MSAEIVDLGEKKKAVDADEPKAAEESGVLEALLKTVEDQARGIMMMARLVAELDARVRKLELAENKRLRKLAIFDPNGKEIA